MAAKKQSSRIQGARAEYRKIQWPTKQETIQYTAVSLVIALAVALFCWVLDLAFGGIVGLVL